MFKIELKNKISKNGLSRLDPALFSFGEGLEDPDGILVRSASLHEMAFPPSLKAIARAGAGVNNIPVEECSKAGIVVFNTPGANANAVKELCIAALFLASRNIAGGIAWAKELVDTAEATVEQQVEKGKSRFAGPEIAGKTLGVIGLGAIGVQVANAAVNLDMHVKGFDPYISVDAAWGLSRAVQRATSLQDIFAASDYITLHVPLTPETRGMINAEAIAQMKDGVRILNFARGALVNDDDIGRALTEGKVACYITDFPSSAVLKMPNVVAIPHLGASTPESEENCAVMAAEEIAGYLLHGNIRNSVNFPDVELPRIGGARLCVIHHNVPNILSKISAALGEKNINIENMVNKSKGQYAYTLVDTDTNDVPDSIPAYLESISGIVRVRLLT